MSEPRRVLTITDVMVEHGGVRELDRVSFHVDAGDTVIILGEASSGKDALMRAISGAVREDDEVSGQITFGESLGVKPRTAYVPGPSLQPLSPFTSAQSQLARVIARRLSEPVSSGLAELNEELARLPGAPAASALAKRAGELPQETLAWGLLAAGLAQKPELLLLDHLFEGVSPKSARLIERALIDAKTRLGATILCSTMMTDTALVLGGRLIVLRHGRVVEEGPVERLTTAQSHSYTQLLFKALPAKPRAGARGQPVIQAYGLALNPKASARNLLNFELRRGGALALLGEQGSGRHATVRKLLGLEALPAGRVVFDAVDIGILSRTMMARLRRHVAVVSGADDVLDPRMTLWDTVAEPLRAHLRLPQHLLADYRELALRRVGLASLPGPTPISALSAFDRRRLQIARALVSAPMLVVADEPFKGLDAFARTVIRDLLQSFRAEEAPAFLVITSDAAVAHALADEVMVFSEGEVVERGLTGDILRAPQNPYTRSVVEASRIVMSDALPPVAATV